jgi:hypothetical protein
MQSLLKTIIPRLDDHLLKCKKDSETLKQRNLEKQTKAKVLFNKCKKTRQERMKGLNNIMQEHTELVEKFNRQMMYMFDEDIHEMDNVAKMLIDSFQTNKEQHDSTFPMKDMQSIIEEHDAFFDDGN